MIEARMMELHDSWEAIALAVYRAMGSAKDLSDHSVHDGLGFRPR
jgi:hypothetical protein